MSEELACIRQVARSFPYVSMDTEFPGVVAKPTGTFRNNSDYQCGRVHWLIPNLLFWPRIVMVSIGRYQCLKVNVDMLRVIPIGITFSDDDGNFPTDTPCTWQFHFSFSLQSDMYAPPPPKCQSSPLRPHSARAATPRTPFSCCALQVTPPCTRFRPRILTLRHLFSPQASTLHIKPGFSTKSLISPQASTLPDTAAWASTCRISGSCS